MRIKIISIAGSDLPDSYREEGVYTDATVFNNFFVGCVRNVYGFIVSGGAVHYLVRLDEDTEHISTYPAALTEVIDATIPASWIVSHEAKSMHRALPAHQVVVGPRDWLCPYISFYLDRLINGDADAISLLLGVARRDYPGAE